MAETGDKSQEALVGGQFGPRAEAYLQSAVHAQGADLQALVDITRDRPEARVLDLGCGGGHVSFSVARQVREVVAYDLSPEMLKVVAAAAKTQGLGNIETKQGLAERLSFADESFDFVLSRFSAHHWRDFEAGLREAARVLKSGGTAVFVDSIAPGAPLLDTYFQAIDILRDCSHVRNYSRAEWEGAMARAGLIPDATKRYRLHLEFTSWVQRMATPKVQVDAIRALQAAVPPSVTRYFETQPDGSFCIDAALFRAAKPVL